MEALTYAVPLLTILVVGYYIDPLTTWAKKHGLL